MVPYSTIRLSLGEGLQVSFKLHYGTIVGVVQNRMSAIQCSNCGMCLGSVCTHVLLFLYPVEYSGLLSLRHIEDMEIFGNTQPPHE